MNGKKNKSFTGQDELNTTDKGVLITFNNLANELPTEKLSHGNFFFIFTFVGTASLICWNTILSAAFTIALFVYNDSEFVDLMVISYQTLSVILQLLLLARKKRSFVLFRYSYLTLSFLCLLTPLVVLYIPHQISKWLLIFIMAVIGCHSGIVNISAMGFASIMSGSACGYVALGYGLSGIVSSAVWNLITKIVWKPTKDNCEKIVWSAFSIAAAIIFLNFLNLRTLANNKIINDRCKISSAKESKVHSVTQLTIATETQSDTEDSERNVIDHGMSRMEALKKSKRELISLFFSIYMTLFIFPTVGPIGWTVNNINGFDSLMASFIVGDFIGYALPNFSYFRPPKKCVIYFVTARIILVIFSIILLIEKYDGFPVQLILMLALAVTNGWSNTLSFKYLPENVTHPVNKEFIGAVGSALLLTGIVSGLWSSKLLKFLVT